MPMGSGKGDVDHFRVRVKPGRILFEISGVDDLTAANIMKQAAYKLPIQIRMVKKGEVR